MRMQFVMDVRNCLRVESRHRALVQLVATTYHLPTRSKGESPLPLVPTTHPPPKREKGGAPPPRGEGWGGGRRALPHPSGFARHLLPKGEGTRSPLGAFEERENGDFLSAKPGRAGCAALLHDLERERATEISVRNRRMDVGLATDGRR